MRYERQFVNSTDTKTNKHESSNTPFAKTKRAAKPTHKSRHTIAAHLILPDRRDDIYITKIITTKNECNRTGIL